MHKLLVPVLLIITLTSLAAQPASARLSYYDGYVVYDSDHPNTIQPAMSLLKLQTASLAPNGIAYTGFTQTSFGAGYYNCVQPSGTSVSNGQNICWTQSSYQQDFPNLWSKFTPKKSFSYHALYTEFIEKSGGTSGQWIFGSEADMWAALQVAGFDYSQVYQSVTGNPLSVGGATAAPTPTSQGTIIIWSTPPGAVVSINGIQKGTTTGSAWLSYDMDAGTYTVTLTESGYQDYTQQVTVTGGAQTQVEAKMTSLTGTPAPTASATATPTPTPKALPGFEGVMVVGLISLVYIVSRGKHVSK